MKIKMIKEDKMKKNLMNQFLLGIILLSNIMPLTVIAQEEDTVIKHNHSTEEVLSDSTSSSDFIIPELEQTESSEVMVEETTKENEASIDTTDSENLSDSTVVNEELSSTQLKESDIEAKITSDLDNNAGVKVTPYEQRIYKKNWDIWNKPYVSGAKSVDKSTKYFEQIVTVTREASSNNTVYVLIKVDNKEIGWINKGAIDSVDPLYTKEGILVENTYKYITKNNWDIWSEPYKSGVKKVKNTSEYLNEKVLFTRRAKTTSGTYVKIWVYRDGRYQYIGWLNETGLSNSIPEINQMSGVLIPNTYGEILKSNWDIWERPYKPGTKSVANTSNYKNQTLLFTRKSVTNSGTYYKMWAKKNGSYQFVGWVSDKGTTLLDKIEYKKSVSVPMKKVSKKNWTLWNSPYVYGSKQKGNSSTYYGKNVQILAEAKTNYGIYYEITSFGKSIGWINKDGLSGLGNEVIVPLIQANQINTAGYAPSGCAACAAYTALHSKNVAMNRNLTWFYNNLPLHSSNPDLGQIGSPWNYSEFKAVISPVGLNNFMKSLGGNSQNITGQSMSYVKKELQMGNPVLFWGRVGLSDTSNSLTTHVMIFTGYKDGYYLVQDPALTGSNHRRWFSEKRVNDYMAIKGRKMVVVR